MFLLLTLSVLACAGDVSALYRTNCSHTLQMGQYLCLDLNIDPHTQQTAGCTPQRLATVKCTAAEGIWCEESQSRTFDKQIPCKYTNGYSFETSLLLSVFLGMFGADRFYLGYPALGLLKLSTLGFLFVGQLLDVLLISCQLLRPADGSDYVISRYGAALNMRTVDELTYRVPQTDW